MTLTTTDDLKILYQNAKQALQQGNWSLACDRLYLIWEQFPGFYPAGFQLGVAQMSLKHWEDAIVTYQRLFDEGHDSPDVCCNLAVSYWKQHALKQALIYFRYTLKHYPYHPETHENLASLYLSYQHFKSALKHLQILVEKHPTDIGYRFNLAASLQRCQIFDEAIYHYRFILNQTPIHLDSFYNLACIYWQLKDLKAAHHFCLLSLKERFHPELEFMRKRIAQEDFSNQDYQQYVHALFENYANHYDFHMQKTLDYQAPYYLQTYLEKLKQTFNHVIDLACGTGLAGKSLKPYSKHLIGIDISKAMLVQAEKTKQYDNLLHQDALTFLDETPTSFDLIVALEFIPYVQSPLNLFKAISQRLSPQGHFIMTFERGETGIGDNGRMQFTEAFIQQSLLDAGLKLIHQEQLKTRRHKGGWLHMLYLDIQKGSSN
ncbi:MAG: methyltransferase domain-containing protein [Gammaproteobacteria bacterium]|nr:methyltransferase domain-containing protein [Gammaproteobacteria bacterium]